MSKQRIETEQDTQIADASIQRVRKSVNVNMPLSGPIVDDDVVRRLKTLRDQVARPGEDVLGDLLGLFIRDSGLRLQALKSAVLSRDAEKKRQAAHALKGSAGNVGAARVAAMAAWVETNDVGADGLATLETEIAAAIAMLKSRLA